MKRNNRGFCAVEGGIVAVLVLLIVAMGYAGVVNSRRKYSSEAYAAWCKLQRRSDFTYEEWKQARRAGLLDMSREAGGGSTVIIPMHSGR